MAERGAGGALAGWLMALVATVVFPLQWVRSYRMAQWHTDDDPRGPAKVVTAIVLGLLLAAGGVLALWGAQEALVDGVYGTLDQNLQEEVFEQAYQDQVALIEQKDIQVPIIQGNLDRALAAVDTVVRDRLAGINDTLRASLQAQWDEHLRLTEELRAASAAGGDFSAEYDAYGEQDGPRIEVLDANFTAAMEEAGVPEEDAKTMTSDLQSATTLPILLADARQERIDAVARVEELRAHHELYERFAADVPARDDDGVRAEIEAFAAARGDAADAVDLEGVERRFATKDRAIGDMQAFFLYWPVWGWFSIFGLLWAPLVFAQGSILHHAWRPSGTVGYRRYPSFSMGMFLLLGAFNVGAPLFSAWAFWDMERRSKEGQIEL